MIINFSKIIFNMNTSCYISPLPIREGKVTLFYGDIFPFSFDEYYKLGDDKLYQYIHDAFVNSLRKYKIVYVCNWKFVMRYHKKHIAKLFPNLSYLTGLTRVQIRQSIIFCDSDWETYKETIYLSYDSPRQAWWLYPFI